MSQIKRGIVTILLGIGIFFIGLAFQLDYDHTMMRFEEAKKGLKEHGFLL